MQTDILPKVCYMISLCATYRMKNVTSIFTHVTSPYLPKRGDCIQPPLTYYIPETTGINNYSYYKNLSEVNQYTGTPFPD